MGLDSVELIMEVEDAFDVKIPDDDACEMRTVGELHHFVVNAIGTEAVTSDVCLTAATFRWVRQTMRSELAIGGDRLRPRDLVDEVLPKARRRAVWAQLQRELRLKLPSLAWPSTVARIVTILAVLLGAACGCLASLSLSNGASIVVATISAMIFGVMISVIASPLAVRPRESFETFRGLTEVIVARNYAELRGRFHTGTAADVWSALRTIVVNQLGVEPEAVTPDARFVQDLGMS